MIDWTIFEKLTQTPGAPGREHPVRELMESYLSPYSDEIIHDRLGSLFGHKKGTGPKVMVAGHMDEVSFLVSRIRSDGFLHFHPLGGWWSQVLLSQRVDVVTKERKMIPGVIGSVPPHFLKDEQKKKPMPIDKMFIDIGARSEDEVRSWGIREGDAIVPHSPYTELEGGNRVLSKAWDNRFGCGLVVELLRELHQKPLTNDLYAGATVQEEVGLRGAKTAANLIQPDIFFAVDTGPSRDTPGMEKGAGELGKGILIRIYDRSMIPLSGMRDFLLTVAEEEGIPYQFYMSQGGTDAGNVHTSGQGIPSAAVGICTRYIHSHGSVVDKDDIEASKAYVLGLIRRLNQSTLNAIIQG